MLTSTQLAEWEAYDRLEPIGGYRQDYRFAQLCNLVVHAVGGKEAEKFTAWDFMPWGPERPAEKVQSVEDMKQILYAIADMRGRKSGEKNGKPR